MTAAADTAHTYDHVRGIYFPIAIGVFALVVGALFVLLVRGARRRSAPGRTSDALGFELGYAAILACVVAFLVVVTFRSETPLDRTAAHPAVRIGVTAAQWSWRFTYANGATVSDVSTWHPAVALVPTGEEVEFFGSSRDVIHGFWVPQLHFQRQFLPGYVTRFDLRFDTSGRYGGECSVFCGEQHSQMHFALEAVSPTRFAQWLAEHAPTDAGAPT
ncbi:MAG TPA: cytochrome c oxidase subunit II [Solirubrobacteraceae bacterium]|jgi:cytochrome c oxidase subunit 2|nr:cytochrome c oxidase subunit II [Solirubrobacteraceae bacterium]